MNNFETKFYLGVDWGEKRIGLSLADSETKLATPFKTVGSLEELEQTTKEEEIDILVVGKPIKMKGEGEGLNPLFLDFIKELESKIPELKIELVDERLTSKQADKLPGGKKEKASRDEISAILILQTFLDSK